MSDVSPQQSELLSAYFDGEVTPIERAAVEDLLAGDADARAELEDYQRLSEELQTLADDDHRIDVVGEVAARLEEPAPAEKPAPEPSQPAKNEQAPKRRRRWRILLPMGIAGTIAAGLLVGLGVILSQQTARRGGQLADSGAESSAAPDGAGAASMAEPDYGETSAVPAGGGAAAKPQVGPLRRGVGGSGGMARPRFSAGGGAAPAGGAVGKPAPPPAGAEVGDLYSYLSRTEQGEVVVVQAYVVDVRRALDQVRYLLAQNQIPVATVSTAGGRDNLLAFEFTEKRPRTDLAVYVQSEPGAVQMALEDLQGQMEREASSNAILEMRIAGVLAPNKKNEGPAIRENNADTSGIADAIGSSENPATRPLAGLGGRGRASSKSHPVSPDKEAASGGFDESAPLPAADQAGAFQTVVNVSNSAITQELQQQRTLRRNQIRLRYSASPNPRHREPGVAPQMGESIRSSGAPSQAGNKQTRASRHDDGSQLRLLLVLRERAPVEAPRPR